MADPTAKELLQRIRSNANAAQAFADYLRERLSEKREAFTQQTKDTFDVHKGRCIELEELIQNLIKREG